MVSTASELLGSTFPVLLTRPHGHMGLPGSDSAQVCFVEQPVILKKVLQGNGNAQQLHSREGVMLRYQRVSC